MPTISEDDESASDGHEPDEEAEDDDGEEEEEEEEEEEQPEGITLCSSVTKLKKCFFKKTLEMLFQFQKKAVRVVVLGFVVGSPLSRDSNIQNLPHASKIKNDW